MSSSDQTVPDGGDGSGPNPLAFNLVLWMLLASFATIAFYNVLELNINVFLAFKRRRGLYFWSLLICSWGTALHAIATTMKFFTYANVYLCTAILNIGWVAMVTGQSFVLYSRLHLVVRDPRILRAVFVMIVVDGSVFHTINIVTKFGTVSPYASQFTTVFNIMEKFQMTVFSVQEIIISAIYVWYTFRLIKPAFDCGRRRVRTVRTQLILINLFIVAMDLAMLSMEYANFYVVEAGIKPAIYSVKLKLEFAVLHQLMRLAHSGLTYGPSPQMHEERLTTTNTNATNATSTIATAVAADRSGSEQSEGTMVSSQNGNHGPQTRYSRLKDRWSRNIQQRLPIADRDHHHHNHNHNHKNDSNDNDSQRISSESKEVENGDAIQVSKEVSVSFSYGPGHSDQTIGKPKDCL